MLMFAVVQNGHTPYFHYVPKSLSLTVSASSVDWPAAGFPCVCLSALRRRAARKRSASRYVGHVGAALCNDLPYPVDQVLEEADARVAFGDLPLDHALGKGHTDFCNM